MIEAASARIFLLYFLDENENEARVFDRDSSNVNRVDPWALRTIGDLPSGLPVSGKAASLAIEMCDNHHAFLDHELWVIDPSNLDQTVKGDLRAQRVASLIGSLNGWSLCFPAAVYPKDLGAEMNKYANVMRSSQTVSKFPKAQVGRPSKIDDAVSAIAECFPDGTKTAKGKDVLKKIEPFFETGISIATVRAAMKRKN